MNTLILFGLLAVSFAKFAATTTYNAAQCQGDFVSFTTVDLGVLPCAESCASLTLNGLSWSQRISCTDRPEVPESALGWAIFDTAGCAGDPTAVLGYGKDCHDFGALAPGKASYRASCDDNGALKVEQYSTNDCTGSPNNGMTQSHPFGCATIGTGSISQIGCPDGAPDYTVYLDGWVKWATATKAWVVASFNTATQKCYQSAGDFSLDSNNNVRVTVTLKGGCSEEEIQNFVDDVCNDLATQVNAGVCINAGCSSGTVGASCTYRENKKRDGQQSSITITGTMNADGDNGAASGLVFPFLALMLSVLALVL